jgi:non-haem Fe2+, alpha-ketoglutarate-dependent halogenase
MKGSYALSDEEVLCMDKNGFIGPFDLYTKDEIMLLRDSLRGGLSDRSFAPYKIKAGNPIENYDRHLDLAILGRHICAKKIVDRVASVIGNDVLCWRSEFFFKKPGDEGTDWHQENNFAHSIGFPELEWPECKYPEGSLTVWTAISDVAEENSCLQFVPGTHKEMFYDELKGMTFDPMNNRGLEKNGVKRGTFGYDFRDLQINSGWCVDESKAVSMEMKAGQFIIFWSTLLHASTPNSSKTQPRLAYAARYVPTKVKIYQGPGKLTRFGAEYSLENSAAVLVSGRDEYKHNRVRSIDLRGREFPVA